MSRLRDLQQRITRRMELDGKNSPSYHRITAVIKTPNQKDCIGCPVQCVRRNGVRLRDVVIDESEGEYVGSGRDSD